MGLEKKLITIIIITLLMTNIMKRDFAGIIEDIIIIKDIINELANSEEKFKLIDINSLGLYLK
ncbi:hypothetical protein P4S72_15415 [Vibrio sp. PP-XX7]